jgi:hypothetical protein
MMRKYRSLQYFYLDASQHPVKDGVAQAAMASSLPTPAQPRRTQADSAAISAWLPVSFDIHSSTLPELHLPPT